jgi:hypothetical protein
LIKLNIPKKLIKNPQALAQMGAIVSLTSEINILMTSRENYRLANFAHTNYKVRMVSYDQEIYQTNKKLLDEIVKLSPSLK